MTVRAGTSGRPPATMAPAQPFPPPHHHPMYQPYPSGSAAYLPPPYPTPTTQPPPRRSSSLSSSYSMVMVADPWSSHRGHHVGGGGRGGSAAAEIGSAWRGHSHRLSLEPNQTNPSPFLLRDSRNPAAVGADLLPYEVLPPYPTPSFDRRYYRRNPSPTGHPPPHHPPATAVAHQWPQHQGQQHYLPPTYAHELQPPPPSSVGHSPLHHPTPQGAGAHGYSSYSNMNSQPIRRISLQPFPLPTTTPAASASAPTPQDGVPHVTSQKKKPMDAKHRASLLLDKSPTTTSFERILECATLIASGPRRTSTPEEESAGTRITAEDATNLAHRLAAAGGDAGRKACGGRPLEVEPTTARTDTSPLQDRTNDSATPLLPSPVLPASKVEAGEDPFAEIARDPDLYKQVVLRMALQKQAYDAPRIRDFTVPPVIGPGFFWRDYPPMEQVLYENMADYYDVTAGRRQSKLQQSFTTRLAERVRVVAADNCWTFSAEMGDKVLRDRIRCFYKTHLQNAKKRLVTLQKHPASADHRSALRVFVRSVRLGISVEESERQEPELRAKYVRSRTSSVDVCPSGGGRPPLRGEIFTTLQKSHQSAPKSATVSPSAGTSVPTKASEMLAA